MLGSVILGTLRFLRQGQKNPPSTTCKSTSLNLPSSSEPSVLRDKVQEVVDFKMELSIVSFSLLF